MKRKMLAPRTFIDIAAVFAVILGLLDLLVAGAAQSDMNKNIPVTNRFYFDNSDVEMVPTMDNYDTSNGNVSIDNRSGKLYGYDDYMGALDATYPGETNDYDYGEYIHINLLPLGIIYMSKLAVTRITDNVIVSTKYQ